VANGNHLTLLKETKSKKTASKGQRSV